MISFINPFKLEEFLEKEGQPVLLACFEKDLDYINHINILEDISHVYKGKIRVCLINNELNLMNKRFGIYGTPTFAIYYRGKQKSIMLGKMNIDEMKTFMKKNMI
ncbi:hypothetical protein QUF70_20230 [Desulfobacterales bacterium HSG17]|nr:hypothetical protein [Desulfobacterales bacterium HSG17]